MQLLLSRHGNTFLPHQTPIWIGSTEDLPLVDSGVQQAKHLAKFIQQQSIQLAAIYCGPLKRTRDYAQIIVNELKLPFQPIIDKRLNELNYGQWAGLSSEEIKKTSGAEALNAWEKQSEWPKSANWQPSPQIVFQEIKSLTKELLRTYASNQTVLMITSNGRLRYFLQLIPGAFEQAMQQKNIKVSTGNICLLTNIQSNKWQIKFWNKKI